ILASFLFCSHPSLRFKTDSNPTRRTPSRPRVSASTFPVNFICGVQVMSETIITAGTTDSNLSLSGTTVDLFGTLAHSTLSSGTLVIENGGLAAGTFSGYTWNGDTLNAVDAYVTSGGEADALVMYNGTINVDAGGKTTDSLMYYGTEIISGNAAYSIIDSGNEIIENGGTANSAVIGQGSTQYISSGGIATSADITGGNLSRQTVAVGGTAYNDYISNYGVAFIYGTLVGGSVDYGVILDEAGATTSNIQILSLQRGDPSGEDVFGLALGSTISGNGLQVVFQGGEDYKTDILNLGTEYISGGFSTLSTINGSGLLYAYNAGTVASPTIYTGGLVTIAAGSTIDNPDINGGTLIMASGAVLAGDVTFTGSGGILNIGDTGASDPVIAAFGINDSIILAGSIASETMTLGADGLATIGNISFDFINGAGMILDVTGTSGGTTTITTPNGETATCFVTGTRIMTPTGEKPVEQLKPGDKVITPEGPQPIRFIGDHAYDGRFIANNSKFLPVCIEQGALGDNAPARDLYVSPGHALLVGNMLVKARDLINGVNIRQIPEVDSVHYYHIGLASHGVVLAEKCWAESFNNVPDAHGTPLIRQFHAVRSILTGDLGDIQAQKPYRRYVEGGVKKLQKEREAIAMRARGLLRGFLEQTRILESKTGKDGHIVAQKVEINGWAQRLDLRHEHTPVMIDIAINGERKRAVLADLLRDDLTTAGIGDGYHAFKASLWLQGDVAAKGYHISAIGPNGQQLDAIEAAKQQPFVDATRDVTPAPASESVRLVA
ncbi:MAG: Hint domain-containing protein, partial [Alphaproteobacteria bacterium]|nr:Hint domain-containing protein [Alphaproteobacteria bacterium]